MANSQDAFLKEMATLLIIFATALVISFGPWYGGQGEVSACGFCRCVDDRLFCTARGLRDIPNLPISSLNNVRVLALQRNFIRRLDVAYLHRFQRLQLLDVSEQSTGHCVRLSSPDIPAGLAIKGRSSLHLTLYFNLIRLQDISVKLHA